MNLFLDTSAVIKLYHEEEGSESLIDLIAEFDEDVILTISDVCKIEFHSAFLRRVRTQEIEREIVEQVFQYFEQDLQFYHIIEVNDSVKQFAIDLLNNFAWNQGLKTLDSIQLASALISHQWFPEAPGYLPAWMRQNRQAHYRNSLFVQRNSVQYENRCWQNVHQLLPAEVLSMMVC